MKDLFINVAMKKSELTEGAIKEGLEKGAKYILLYAETMEQKGEFVEVEFNYKFIFDDKELEDLQGTQTLIDLRNINWIREEKNQDNSNK